MPGKSALRACGAALMLVASLAFARAGEGKFIPAPNRVDMAYDDAHGVLYISSTDSQILRYQLSTGTFLSPIIIDGNYVMGMDLSPDGKTLAAAQLSYDLDNHQNWIRLIDLDTLAVQTVRFDQAFGEGGTFTVNYGSNGKIVVASVFNGSAGKVPLRLYDPAAGTTSTIAQVNSRVMLAHNPSRTVLAFVEGDNGNGPYGKYLPGNGYYKAVGEQLFEGGTGAYNYEIGVNRDQTYFAIPTVYGTYIADKALDLIGLLVPQSAKPPVAAVFHPKKPLLYLPVQDTKNVLVYDTTTWQAVDIFRFDETFGHNGNYAFGDGREKLSKDGRLLFVNVTGGVRYVKTRHGRH